MTTKHTPGPLRKERTGDQFRIVSDSKERRGVIVAYVPMLGNDIWKDEAEANAILFAAAPETAEERDRLKEINAELLEALEEALAMFGANADYGEDDKNAVGMMQSAIARARGTA